MLSIINFLLYNASLKILGKIIDTIQYTNLIFFSINIYIICLKIEQKIRKYCIFSMILLIINISILLYILNITNNFIPNIEATYSLFGFFKYFLDSQLDKNLVNKNRRPFDYQLICGFLGTALAIILFILGFMLCHETEYNPRFLILCSFIFTNLIIIGLHNNLEFLISYFLGIPNFLMKLNVGMKFFI